MSRLQIPKPTNSPPQLDQTPLTVPTPSLPTPTNRTQQRILTRLTVPMSLRSADHETNDHAKEEERPQGREAPHREERQDAGQADGQEVSRQQATSPQEATGQHLADLWQTVYQAGGQLDAFKKQHFESHQKVELTERTSLALSNVMPAFAGDKGTDPEKLSTFMEAIARHESLGGKHLVQIGGGPARSAWQVEPATAIDVVKTSGLLGPRFEKTVGITRHQLSSWSAEDWSFHLEKWPELAAAIATAKVLQSATHYNRLKDLS